MKGKVYSFLEGPKTSCMPSFIQFSIAMTWGSK